MEKGGGRTVARRATFALQVATPCEGGGIPTGEGVGGLWWGFLQHVRSCVFVSA